MVFSIQPCCLQVSSEQPIMFPCKSRIGSLPLLGGPLRPPFHGGFPKRRWNKKHRMGRSQTFLILFPLFLIVQPTCFKRSLSDHPFCLRFQVLKAFCGASIHTTPASTRPCGRLETSLTWGVFRRAHPRTPVALAAPETKTIKNQAPFEV